MSTPGNSCNGREWNDATYGTVHENPCVGAPVNDSPASTNKDIVSQLKALDAAFDFTYFANVTAVGGFGKYIAYSFGAGNQGTMAYFCWYDTQAKTVVKYADSWRTYPMRDGVSHGNLLVHNTDSSWALASVNAASYFRGGSVGSDFQEMSIISITGRGDNNLPSNYFTACPAGLDQRWQALGATSGAMRCVEIVMDGEPRLENPSTTDCNKWPKSPLGPSQTCGAGAWSQIQTIAEGDEWVDQSQGNGGVIEHFTVVKKTADVGNRIRLMNLRGPAWSDFGACAVPSAHTPLSTAIMVPPAACNIGTVYWVNINGNGAAIPEDFAIGAAHLDSSGIGPNGGIVAATSACRQGAIPATAGQPSYNCDAPRGWPFNGSDPWNSAFITEAHPGYRQINAPLSEQGWVIEGYPYGGAIGGATTICALGSITLQGGTSTVYKLSLAGGSCPAIDMKNYPLQVSAGRFILGDISSATSGNQVTDAAPYRWCYTRVINECRTGSSIGDIYAAIPFGETGTPCSFSNFDINAPCVFAKYGLVANILQVGVSSGIIGSVSDATTAATSRRLGYGFTVPTLVSNYWSGVSDPDGQWAFFSPSYADNMLVTQYFAYKLPPTPPRDSIARNQYVSIPMRFNGVAGDTIRVRFGYAEFGSVDGTANSLYCTSRTETCYGNITATVVGVTSATIFTVNAGAGAAFFNGEIIHVGSQTGTILSIATDTITLTAALTAPPIIGQIVANVDPFVYAAEPQSYTPCNPNCTVNVPALSNRTLYWQFDRKNGSAVTTSLIGALVTP